MHPDRDNQFRPALEYDPPKFVDRVDTPWSDVPDLPEYNQRQYRRLERSLRQLTQNRSEVASSQGVLVLGEAGTGKTHLLMRVASNLSHTNHILFVRKPNNEETVAHHVWSNIVSSLTRSVPSSGTQRSQLDDLLAHVFSRVLISNFKEDVEKGVQVDQRQKWIADLEGSPFKIFDMLGSGERRSKNLNSLRNRTLRYFLLHYPDVDQKIAHVLITYCFTVQEDRKRMLLTWLTGQDIDEADAEFLGLPPSWTDAEDSATDTSLQQQREEQSLRAIRTVGILSTLYQPLILAFDQLEGLRDEVRLTQRWGDVVREIFTMTPNMLVVTCIFPSLWETWFKPNLERSVVERIAQSQFELESFQSHHALTMLQTHMQESFVRHSLPTNIYPFTDDDVPVLCGSSSSPRSFVQAARNAFEQWLDEAEDVADLSQTIDQHRVVTQEDVEKALERQLDGFRKQQEKVYHSEIPIEEDFFGRIRSIIKTVVTSFDLECQFDRATYGTRVMPPNLLIRNSHGESICIAVMYRMGISFAARLKNLRTLHREGLFEHLVMIRDGRCGGLGTKCRSYVDELDVQGIPFILAGMDEVALINAIYDTLVSIEEHDVMIGSQEVSKRQFANFLKANRVHRESKFLRESTTRESPLRFDHTATLNSVSSSLERRETPAAEATSPVAGRTGNSDLVSWEEMARMRGVPDFGRAARPTTPSSVPRQVTKLAPERNATLSAKAQQPPHQDGFQLPPAKILQRSASGEGSSSARVTATAAGRGSLDVVIGDEGVHGEHQAVLGTLTEDGRRLGISLTKPQCLAILGYMGSGKSYALGVLIENALLQVDGLISQPRPLSVLAFNYRRNPDSRFEYGGFRAANSNAAEVEALAEQYGAAPQGIREVNVFAYEPELERRASDYEGLSKYPIQFRSDELSAEHWEILMKPPTAQTEYMDIIRNVIQGLYYQSKLDFENLEREILGDDRLSESQRRRAVNRLTFASQWINDERPYEWCDVLGEGTLNIVDLRMQTSSSDEALKLCLIITDLARRTKNGVNKLVVFDEAHEYVDSKQLINELENAVTQIRHDGMSFVLASQFPDRIPERIFKYLLTRLLFKLPHAAGVKYLHKVASNLKYLSEHNLSNLDLEKGICYVQSDDDASDPRMRQPRMLSVRPRCSHHGGATIRQTAGIADSPNELGLPNTDTPEPDAPMVDDHAVETTEESWDRPDRQDSLAAASVASVPGETEIESGAPEGNDSDKTLADLNEEFGIPWNRFLDLLHLPRNHADITPTTTLGEARKIAQQS